MSDHRHQVLLEPHACGIRFRDVVQIGGMTLTLTLTLTLTT